MGWVPFWLFELTASSKRQEGLWVLRCFFLLDLFHNLSITQFYCLPSLMVFQVVGFTYFPQNSKLYTTWRNLNYDLARSVGHKYASRCSTWWVLKIELVIQDEVSIWPLVELRSKVCQSAAISNVCKSCGVLSFLHGLFWWNHLCRLDEEGILNGSASVFIDHSCKLYWKGSQ